MKPLCSFLPWRSPVQLCFEGKDLLEGGAKPACPGRSSRRWYASGACCCLVLQGSIVTGTFFFPQEPGFLSRHIHASTTFAPYLQALDEGSSDVRFSSTQKSLSCRLRAWKLPWGATDTLNWSYGEGVWCVLWVLHSQWSMFWDAAHPFCQREKGKVYQCPYLHIVSKVFPPSLWACLQEKMVEHAVRFCSTQ